MKRLTVSVWIFLIALCNTPAFANQFVLPSDTNPYCVPTFECLGVYYLRYLKNPWLNIFCCYITAEAQRRREITVKRQPTKKSLYIPDHPPPYFALCSIVL